MRASSLLTILVAFLTFGDIQRRPRRAGNCFPLLELMLPAPFRAFAYQRSYS